MMRFPKSVTLRNALLALYAGVAAGLPATNQHHLNYGAYEAPASGTHNVSARLFAELEEFARLVDIAYCVGLTGIQAPFECASRCDEFPGYELVDVGHASPSSYAEMFDTKYVAETEIEQTWNTGPLLSDSCGYIALDHSGKRFIVAFRGTYSITNTIIDLATIPQEYVPYPGDPDDDPDDFPAGDPNSSEEGLSSYNGAQSRPWQWLTKANDRMTAWFSRYDCLAIEGQGTRSAAISRKPEDRPEGPKCSNCTVHMGFYSSWKDCRRLIIPHLKHMYKLYPSYKLYLVGHSLGGAVAGLAALETEVLGWHPTITTFGEPRIGNTGLRDYFNAIFKLDDTDNGDANGGRYRRMTHSNDPVPLLPLTEWGYKMHSGEIYISKPELQPSVPDLRLCEGDEDRECIFGGESEAPFVGGPEPEPLKHIVAKARTMKDQEMEIERLWSFPARYRIWQLFFAHRDYFWRLGLCVKGGDPIDWGRRYDNLTNDDFDDPKWFGDIL